LSRRILIIDLEDDLLNSLQELMEMGGYKVTTLSDLRKAFDICTKTHFDIVLSHWTDPFLKVDEVFDQLKLMYPLTKYIIMTGSIEIQPEIEKKYTFIYKPFQIDELERLLQSI
jgi:DNA-binding NtrC family response regulator